MSLGLPAVSAGLKSIAPYLQRAEELVDSEPVVAYWCKGIHDVQLHHIAHEMYVGAYYAAQVGIKLKAKDNASRTLLLNLLNALERMKSQIGPSDAIAIEAASAAYVENFALRIFRMADDEDREGHATRYPPIITLILDRLTHVGSDQLQKSFSLQQISSRF
jgi:vacuolar protein sorting-associated protein VTA1